tara:strand:- start:220 stop:825 length:606 start_codon:yes stop_codon:yes gene_type:complete
MWAYVKDGVVEQVNAHQTRLQPNPGQYFQTKYADEWTKEQKEAYGVYEVEEDTTNLKNSDFYTNGAETVSFGSGKVTRSWGTATAKSLADVNFTQADQDAGRGTKDELNYRGLTYLHKEVISKQAHDLLSPTDWYASRKAEAGTAIPSAVGTYRAAVRTKAAAMHDLIDAADTVDKLAALYVYNSDNPPTRPLGEWPDPVE